MIRLSLIFSILLTTSAPVWACGGFFCNAAQPINQAAERIFFAPHEDKMEMHVRIEYSGPRDNFGWLLPTPAGVEVSLSTEALFDALDASFGPQFIFNPIFDPDCPPPPFAVNEADGAAGGGPRGVQVVSREAVGPYDRVILQAENVNALREWLNTNEFAIPEALDPKLEPYIRMRAHFVAIKLNPQSDVSDITPIKLVFPGMTPTIPIIPTAVAADPDMGILVHILGDHRAIPTNYRHVIINEAALDLRNGGVNYTDVVSQAVDEAGGLAFATDFAGEIDESFTNGVPVFDLELLGQAKNVSEILESGIVIDADLQRVMNGQLDLPADVTVDQFWNCPRCFEMTISKDLDMAAIVERVRMEVNPAREGLQALFVEHRYLTRLYSTMSPDEMNVDPAFAFNRDLEDVANVRTIDVRIECNEENEPMLDQGVIVNAAGQEVAVDLTGRSATRRQNGETVRGMDIPAAAIIEQMMEAGQPERIGGMSDQMPMGGAMMGPPDMPNPMGGTIPPMVGGAPTTPDGNDPEPAMAGVMAGAMAGTPSPTPTTNQAATAGQPAVNQNMNSTGGATPMMGGAAPPVTQSSSDDGGCSCDSQSGSESNAALFMFVALLGLIRRRSHTASSIS